MKPRRVLVQCLAVAAAVAVYGGAATAQGDFVRAPGSPYPTGSQPYDVVPGDFNGDPLTDLAVLNGTSSNVHVFDQLAVDGGFGLASGSPFAVGSGPSYETVADFNGDGRQDLAVANYAGNSVSVEIRQSDNTFAAQPGSPLALGDKASAIASGDFTGDGKPDLAVAEWNSGLVKIFVNTGSGFAGGSTVGTGTHPRYIAVGDLDGVGGPDLAVSNIASGNLSVLLNQTGSPGSFTAAGPPIPVGSQPGFVVVAPLDANATPDIAVSNYGSNTVAVLDRQAGAGVFAPAVGSPFAVGSGPEGLAAGDLDQSGGLDLVTADHDADALSVLTNTGSSFTRQPDISTAPDNGPSGVATGELNDGDARPDIAFTDDVSNNLNVFLHVVAPAATTGDATGLDTASATLNGTVNPQGADTDAHFEYGTSTAYGSVAPAGGEVPVGTDSADHAVSRAIGGLAPGTTYHFRIVASSVGGRSVGDDKAFTTSFPPPHDGSPAPPASSGSGPPEAYLRAPTEIAAGTPTTLSTEGSSPSGGLTYRLDLDGSGRYATDLKTARSLDTTFSQPGDVKVGLRVTDGEGRTDTVRRTVHVTAPPLYGLTFTPKNPEKDQTVHFTVRRLVDDPAARGKTIEQPLSGDAIATMTYGDGSDPTGKVDGLIVPGHAASGSGDFNHAFGHSGRFTVHATVNDGNGYQTGVDEQVDVGLPPVTYQPALSTPTTTVFQGSCVGFTNANGDQLADKDTGPVITQDINPAHQIIQIKPPNIGEVTFGGPPIETFNPVALRAGAFAIGSPFTALQFASPALSLQLGGRAKARQVEVVTDSSGDDDCARSTEVENAVHNIAHPYLAGSDKGWRLINSCQGGYTSATYSDDETVNLAAQTRAVQTTRHAFFSANNWDFGDGTKSGPEGWLPTATEYHPYNKAGTFTVKLTTTFPRKLTDQIGQYNAACTKNPINATKGGDDDRVASRSTEVKLRVKAIYNRVKVRGLWLAGTFDETDLPGVYESSGSIAVNTRRTGVKQDPHTGVFDYSQDLDNAEGILIVTPDDQPLRVVPDQGEIIGAAHLAWESDGRQLALGPVGSVGGVPGLVIPNAGPGGTHDFGVFTNPPASLGSGPPPAPGQPFHVNSAGVVLREGASGGGGGTIELNIHTPDPVGDNGQGSDQTIIQSTNGKGRSLIPSGLLDNVDVDLPAVDLAPGVLSFNGGKLSHHVKDTPPWVATGSLSVFGKTVDVSPNSKKPGCPVVGGLGFNENGSLANAGAVLDGLTIPIPNPPAPDPFTQLANPSLQIIPGTDKTPLDLFGCLTLEDFPDGDAFQLVGCAGFLDSGSGIFIPDSAVIRFCPDQHGNENFARTATNSSLDAGHPGTRKMSGVVVRVTGTVSLGPGHYRIAGAYFEYRDSPFALEVKAALDQTFLDGDLRVYADLFGYIRGKSDWAIGGEGGISQKIICLPIVGCPGVGFAALVSSQGIGACGSAFGFSVGADIVFKGPDFNVLLPCGLSDLESDLGVMVRSQRLGSADQMLRRPGDPVAVMGQAQTGTIDLPGGTPSAQIIVNGTNASPVVQVRDPDGKLVLDDTGAAVQGLPAPGKPPAAVDLNTQQPPEPQGPATGPAPQGILHNDSDFHDATVDMRHTTLIMLRDPKKGRYTITAKPGSAPITAISHAVAFPTPQVHAGVVGHGSKRMLTLASVLPAGESMSVSEEGRNLSHSIAVIASAKASSTTPVASVARASRHVRFHPAPGDAGRRRLIAVISRNGIPQQRIVLGSYVAPAAPQPGRVRHLRARIRHGRMVVSWARAANATRYVVRVRAAKGHLITRGAKAAKRKLTVDDPMLRNGATVSVTAIGPLTKAGRAVKLRVKAPHVKRIRHFRL